MSPAIHTAYHAPGVYLRPPWTDQPDLRLVRTDVAGFVGFAERGPLPPDPPGAVLGTQRDGRPFRAEDVAIRITSFDEFRSQFGGFIANGYLAYAVRGFFENGGTTCYVVRVAGTQSHRATTARWFLPGETVHATQLLDAAPAMGTSLVPKTFPSDGGAEVVEIRDPTGGAAELHWIAEYDGNTLRLGGALRGSYPSGSSLRLYRAALVIEAATPGNWGNRLRLDISPRKGAETTDFALRVTLRRTDPSQPREEELYRRLSLDEQDPAYAPNVVNTRSGLIRFTRPEEVTPAKSSKGAHALLPAKPLEFTTLLSTLPPSFEGGQDGLSGVRARDFTGGLDDLRGLRLLEEIDEVAILCAPDAVFESLPPVVKPPRPPLAPCQPPRAAETSELPPVDPTSDVKLSRSDVGQIHAAMLDQCERLRDRVAIVDAPSDVRGVRQISAWRGSVNSRFGALYIPWLKISDPSQVRGSQRAVPPSGHVAGIYARIDGLFGVHRPPANAVLEGVADLVEEIDAPQQEELNPVGINVIRAFPGRGIRVWGARTLAGKDDAEWRFIHARRLVSMIEESVEAATQWTVFEPNDDNLRRTLVHTISGFLRTIWQRGGLKGNAPGEAFFVRCDETNNTRAVVDAGQLVCQIGVAVTAPMEFLVFDLRQRPEGAELTEP